MAGIYIHIPFCRQKCFYCDFYKSLKTGLKGNFIEALKQEIERRKSYLESEEIETIYFGGGTPSIFTISEIESIITKLNEIFQIGKDAEITLEANPDDLTFAYLTDLRKIGINRLSIGIQSFNDNLLKFMNRRHDSGQAVDSVLNAEKAGFDNISVDLIYGIPGLTMDEWIKSLNEVFRLPVAHLSAYHLTYHEGTRFFDQLKKGIFSETPEIESIEQFKTLIDLCSKNGFEQYEISNFARNRMYSKHNSSYWFAKKYLGLGPSAHSYNGDSRQWNVSNIETYITAVQSGNNFYEVETLSENEKFNELILTMLRTRWGISEKELREMAGSEKTSFFILQIDKYIKSGLVQEVDGTFTLSPEGQFISDEIMANLMIV